MTKRAHRTTIVPVFQVGVEMMPTADMESFRIRLQKAIEDAMPEIVGSQVVHTGYDPAGYKKVFPTPEVYVILRKGGASLATSKALDAYTKRACQRLAWHYDEYEGERIEVRTDTDTYSGHIYYPLQYPFTLIDMVDAMGDFARQAIDSNRVDNHVETFSGGVEVYQHILVPQEDQAIMVVLVDTERLPEAAE